MVGAHGVEPSLHLIDFQPIQYDPISVDQIHSRIEVRAGDHRLLAHADGDRYRPGVEFAVARLVSEPVADAEVAEDDRPIRFAGASGGQRLAVAALAQNYRLAGLGGVGGALDRAKRLISPRLRERVWGSYCPVSEVESVGSTKIVSAGTDCSQSACGV